MSWEFIVFGKHRNVTHIIGGVYLFKNQIIPLTFGGQSFMKFMVRDQIMTSQMKNPTEALINDVMNLLG